MLDKVPEGAGDVMNQLHIWKKAPRSLPMSFRVGGVGGGAAAGSLIRTTEHKRCSTLRFKTYMIKIFIPQPFA